MKIDLTRKAQFCANGIEADALASITFLSVGKQKQYSRCIPYCRFERSRYFNSGYHKCLSQCGRRREDMVSRLSGDRRRLWSGLCQGTLWIEI